MIIKIFPSKRTNLVIFLFTIILLIVGISIRMCSQSSNKTNFNSKINNSIDRELGDHKFIVRDNRILLSEEIRKSLSIQTEQSISENFTRQLELTGIVFPDPDKTESIGSRIPGRVIRYYKKEGELVKKGEIIVSIDSPDVARIRSQYNSIRSKLDASKRNTIRITELNKNKLASDQERRNSESETKILEAELTSVKENLKLQGILPDSTGTTINLRAGISGRVLDRFISPGEPISENMNIIRIGDLSYVWFRISLFEKDLSRVSIGQKVTVVLNAYPEDKLEGRLEFIGSAIDRESGSIPSRILLPNSDGRIKLGLTGKAYIHTEMDIPSSASNQAWSSMESSIVEIDGIQGVFIVHNDREYEWNPIQILGSSNGYVYWKDNNTREDKLRVYVKEGGYQLKALFLKSKYEDGN